MQTIWILLSLFSICVLVFQKKVVFSFNNYRYQFDNSFLMVFIFIIGLTILMAANRTGYDALAFERFFDYIQQSGKNLYDYTYEFLYRIINYVSYILPSLTYPQFHAICVFICLFLICYTLLKTYAANIPLVLSLYALSGTMAQDGMQFKNFLAVTFLMLALWKLLGNKTRKNIVLFWIFLLIASLFHFSFSIYALLFFIENERFKKITRYFPFIGLLGYLVFLVGGVSITQGILALFARISFFAKAGNYDTTFAGYRSIVPVVIYFSVLGVFEFLHRRKVVTFAGKEVSEKLLVIWRLMGIFLPLLVYANAMYRLYRNLYIVVFMAFSNMILAQKRASKNRWLSIIMVLFVIFLIFIYPILLGFNKDIYLSVIDGFYFWER